MKMEPGGIKKGAEEIEAETSIDGSYCSVTQSDEENEIRVLKWQFELILNTIDDTTGSR
jgi:hypothetical protein